MFDLVFEQVGGVPTRYLAGRHSSKRVLAEPVYAGTRAGDAWSTFIGRSTDQLFEGGLLTEDESLDFWRALFGPEPVQPIQWLATTSTRPADRGCAFCRQMPRGRVPARPAQRREGWRETPVTPVPNPPAWAGTRQRAVATQPYMTTTSATRRHPRSMNAGPMIRTDEQP